MYIVEKNTLLINDHVIRLQFFMWGIKLATRKIIHSQTLIIWGWRNQPNFLWKRQSSYNQQIPPKANYHRTTKSNHIWSQANVQGKGTNQANTWNISESLIKEYMEIKKMML